MNINNFLTPKSKPFYDHIISIIEKLNEYQKNAELPHRNGAECDIVIFGGFIRDLILHYFEYQKNQDIEFIKPKDIDTWFHYISIHDNEYRKFSHSMTSWQRYLSTIKKMIHEFSEYDIKNQMGYTISYDLSNYCVYTMEIDGINFDMCANINNYSGNAFTTFKNLSDFTVNNLYIDTKGQLKKRIDCPDYTIDDCIEDIKNKKLHNIYVDLGKEYGVCFDKRKKKMLDYGYTY